MAVVIGFKVGISLTATGPWSYAELSSLSLCLSFFALLLQWRGVVEEKRFRPWWLWECVVCVSVGGLDGFGLGCGRSVDEQKSTTAGWRVGCCACSGKRGVAERASPRERASVCKESKAKQSKAKQAQLNSLTHGSNAKTKPPVPFGPPPRPHFLPPILPAPSPMAAAAVPVHPPSLPSPPSKHHPNTSSPPLP